MNYESIYGVLFTFFLYLMISSYSFWRKGRRKWIWKEVMKKKIWIYIYDLCSMYECAHRPKQREYIFYLSSDWWMILWERKKAQIKLENHKIWFVWYDNIMEKGNTNFFGLVCNNNICFMECALIKLSIQSKLMLK